MSELKAYGINGLTGYVVESERGQLYLKSEVDKVIAEKDAELHNLKRALINARHELAWARGKNKYRAKFKEAK